MKRTVLTFGLIAGGILSLMLLVTLPFHEQIGDKAELIGYTSMIAAFLLIFFGVRSYRDNVGGGRIGFGRAFVVGALIAVVASACYVVAWEIVYYGIVPDFGEKYMARVLQQAQQAGATAEALAAQRAEMARFVELYRNPLFNIAITFIEPLPVGLLMALVSAAVLRRDTASPARRDVVVA